jgi:hypothetical protein
MDQAVWLKVDSLAINLYDEKSGRLLTPDGEAPEAVTGK